MMMQLGVSAAGMMGGLGDGVAAPAQQPQENDGGASGGSSEVAGDLISLPLGDVEKSGGGGGGNRWPRQETLALLQIRHDMDAAFRESSLKGPLWEEVSRKMAEFGFQRSAKKCKEKFENVFKYHKRTKHGRASKSDAKTYRFFDQLQALENTPPQPPSAAATPAAAPPPPPNLIPLPPQVTTNNTTNYMITTSPSPTPITIIPPPQASISHHHHHRTSFPSNSTSSSTSSDEDIQRRGGSSSGGNKKKRKWEDYFERLMSDVVHKQEDMQKKFLEALERRDSERAAREEALRVREIARMNRERELLAKERQIAAAKDDSVISLLQKVTGQNNLKFPANFTSAATPQKSQPPPPLPAQQKSITFTQTPPGFITTATTALTAKTSEASKPSNGGGGGSSSSRWPKAETQALIDLRTSLDLKYHDSGPKGPLWAEISSEMSKLGYSRNAKRCKEKWENINKYYKKVKESNRKRLDDSKTCPYFHQLEALYKARKEVVVSPTAQFDRAGFGLKPDNNPLVPVIMAAQPKRKDDQEHHQEDENESNNNNIEDDDYEDDDDDDQGGGYEMIST